MVYVFQVVNDFYPAVLSWSKARTMPNRLCFAVLLALTLLIAPLAESYAAPPKKAQPILTVDQVAVGMKGYGMTVFHGTKIEPFNVEVVSISANETASRAVIWVRCTDERMINTGPVQGMSGSPIYLWADGEEQAMGKGGKLIGAFAFGYGDTNECMAGIQPIEYMRAVGARATAEDRPKLSKLSKPGTGLAMMSRLHDTSQTMQIPELTKTRIKVMRDLYKSITPSARGMDDDKLPMIATPGGDRMAMRMMVPMAVGSREIANAMAPLMTPHGIQPFAADPTAIGGKPPKGFDTENVELEPGSALVVPYAWGDLDLSGAGTVTDVLPDGTVLGFGHAMDGVGVTAMPMATGYVHFIVSLRTISYKRSGALELKGALVQDEQAAVAGTSDKPYTSAPVKVAINIEGQPKYNYNYEVLNHPGLTPMLAAIVVSQSSMAVQGAPTWNTVRYNTKVKFSSGHEFEFDSAAVGAGGGAAAMFLSTVIGAMTENPFEKVELESVDTTVDVDYGFDAYEVFSAKLDKLSYEPGETATVTLQLMGLKEKIVTKKLTVKIPDDMPVGDTQLMLASASDYTNMMFNTRPELNHIKDLDGLAKTINTVFDADPTKLYAMLPTRRVGLALDGERLKDIPQSKGVVLATGNPWAEFFMDFDTTEIPMDRIMLSGTQLRLSIKKPQGTR